MKLYIDTTSNERTIVRLGDKELVSGPQHSHSQVVLPMIKKLLGKRPMADITEIEVNPGPGSFTGLRVGAAIASALGYVLNIPVKGSEAILDFSPAQV